MEQERRRRSTGKVERLPPDKIIERSMFLDILFDF